jgi:hypothetical protein
MVARSSASRRARCAAQRADRSNSARGRIHPKPATWCESPCRDSASAFGQEHARAIEPHGRLLLSSDDHRAALLLRDDRITQPTDLVRVLRRDCDSAAEFGGRPIPSKHDQVLLRHRPCRGLPRRRSPDYPLAGRGGHLIAAGTRCSNSSAPAARSASTRVAARPREQQRSVLQIDGDRVGGLPGPTRDVCFSSL